MKTKLKETLITFALDYEKCRKFYRIFFITMVATGCFMLFLDRPPVPITIWAIINIVALMFWKCVEAIRKNKLILDRNKLVNIILSSEDVWYYSFLWVIIYPVLIVIAPKTNFFISIVCAIIMAFLGIFLSRAISKHFDKKLKKIEFLR